MPKPPTIQEFFKQFPDDNTCLDHLMDVRYGNPLDCPKCGKAGKYHRLRKEPAYACQWCGHRIYPMADTPFERTRTPLQKWFYALYLFTTSRHGVPAKELQRQLGVTYKTAWRMGHEIRKYMARVDGDDGLSGHVEIDETMVGGYIPKAKGTTTSNKAVVLGMLERGGDVVTKVVPNKRRHILLPIITANVAKGSIVDTDELGSYRILRLKGYGHRWVNHSIKEYVRGDVHTNTLDNFWAQLKRSINGTHIHVSKKHLAKYLGEFEFRYNMRKRPGIMFDLLLASF